MANFGTGNKTKACLLYVREIELLITLFGRQIQPIGAAKKATHIGIKNEMKPHVFVRFKLLRVCKVIIKNQQTICK